MQIEWQFTAKGKASIKAAVAFINLWHGAVRSGKTILSLITWLIFLEKYAPNGDLAMIGKTERTLKRNILMPLESIVGSRNFQLNRGEGELYLLGRRIYLVGANDERSESKIRGMTLAGAYADEVTLYPESFFMQLIARCSLEGARIFATTNPDSPYHWLKTSFVDKEDGKTISCFHFSLGDNPALGSNYVESLKAVNVGLFYKRFIEGLWVQAEGAVYDFFDENIHVIDEAPETDFYDLPIDYGTSNATAAGLIGSRKTEETLKCWLEKTYYYSGKDTGKHKTDSEHVRDIKIWLGGVKPRYVIVDPSAASFKVELRRNGFNVIDADNRVLDGIRTQAKMLKNGEYKIVKNQENEIVIRDYSAYLWDAKAQDKGEDKPLKQNDHTKDFERYYLQTLYGDPIEPTTEEDMSYLI